MFDSVTSAHGHASAPPRIAIAVSRMGAIAEKLTMSPRFDATATHASLSPCRRWPMSCHVPQPTMAMARPMPTTIAAYCSRRDPGSAIPATCHTRASMMQPIAEPALPMTTKITRSVDASSGSRLANG